MSAMDSPESVSSSSVAGSPRCFGWPLAAFGWDRVRLQERAAGGSGPNERAAKMATSAGAEQRVPLGRFGDFSRGMLHQMKARKADQGGLEPPNLCASKPVAPRQRLTHWAAGLIEHMVATLTLVTSGGPRGRRPRLQTQVQRGHSIHQGDSKRIMALTGPMSARKSTSKGPWSTCKALLWGL